LNADDPDVKDLGDELDQTRYFADRCTILLEEARFLLGNIGPSEIRKRRGIY